MKVIPVASKAHIAQTPNNEQSTKARAIAAFKGSSSPTTPSAPQHASHPTALNQNALGVEDLGSLNIPQPNIQAEEPDKETLDEVSQTEETVAAAPPVEAPKAEPADPALSRQFAQLARQEKALRAKVQQQEAAWKQREADLKAREAALTSQAAPDLSQYIPRDRLKSDPLSVLAEAEVSYEDLTQRIVNRVPVDPQVQATINDLKAQIQELKKYNEDGKKSATDNQQAQYQAAVKQIHKDATALVKSDPIAYEAIHKTGTVKDVVKLIEDTYNKDGILMTVEEAAQEVENYLVEENFNMATRIDKIKKRLGQVAPAQAPAKQSPVSPQQSQMKTLTNATSSSRPLSARERALLAFEGKLK